MAQLAMDFDDDRRKDFRRVLLFSLVAHFGVFATLALVPSVPSFTPVSAIPVSLVSLPSPASRPAVAPPPSPAPKPPAPAPVAPPKPPKPAPVVLPTEARVPKPKPPAKPEPPPKAPPKQEPRVEPKPAPQQEYADVMASLRGELGEEVPAPAQQEAPTRVAVAGGPSGPSKVSPELAAWLRDAKIHIRRSWVVPPGFRTQSLTAVVEVEVGPGGIVGDRRVSQGSGNPWYDDGVLRSIEKASPLPAPPRPMTVDLIMVSDEF